MNIETPDDFKLTYTKCTHYRRGALAMFAAIGYLADIAGASCWKAMIVIAAKPDDRSAPGGAVWQWIYSPSMDEVFTMLVGMRKLASNNPAREIELDNFGAKLSGMAKGH